MPTIEQIRALADLVTAKITITDARETTLGGYLGDVKAVLVIRGDALLGPDLSNARIISSDSASRTITIELPQPHLISYRLDHTATRLVSLSHDGLWIIVPGDAGRTPVLNRAYAEAETLETRLVDHLSSKSGLPWNTLSIVAANYPELSQELLNRIESEPSLPMTSNLLRFISAVRPKSLLLRGKCFETFKSHRREGSADETVQVAAEIVASQFRDEETLVDLLKLAPVGAPGLGSAYGPLLALSDGWPESVELELRINELIGKMVPWDLYFALGPTDLYSPEGFITALAKLCRERGPYEMGAGRRVFRFCVRHLKRSDLAYKLLVNHFLAPADDNICVSAPVLLSAASGVGPLGRWQLLKRLEQELSGRSEPTVGYDLRSDQMRSASLAILDVLTSGEHRGTL